MFLGEASYRPRTGLVQASYRPRTGAFYRRLEKRRRLRRLFSPWRLKVSTALLLTNEYTLPPERTQPQKLCTANFSSGTLKTLINRLLRLKNKIF